jgi:hypothetical protein
VVLVWLYCWLFDVIVTCMGTAEKSRVLHAMPLHIHMSRFQL